MRTIRRAVLLTLLVALVSALPLAAQLAYIDDEQITVTNTAVGLTAAKISPAGKSPPSAGACRVELAEIRFRKNGSAATATVGTLAEIGDVIAFYNHDELQNFSAIRTTATSGQLDCTYWK